MFDVFYYGDSNVKQFAPFAKQISDRHEINPKTKMYWVIEPNIELLDTEILMYRPPDYDQCYEHVWKWNNTNYGGIRLVPTKGNQGVKEINKVVCSKVFDILYKSDPGNYFKTNPFATHVWCVDPDYKLADTIDWAPDNFEPDFIHTFHLKGQLEHKYPQEEGGVILYPRNWHTANKKHHMFLDANVKFPVMLVDDVDNYAQRDIYSDQYVWLIDKQHRVNEKTLDWVPNPFEDDMTHSFRMPYQLTEKYPLEMGGIRLVPKNWKTASLKVHKDCPVEDENYDVFYTNKAFDAETFAYYAKRSETDWFWVLDKDYDFNGKLLYVPAEHEQEYIHAFKWGLSHRYLPDVIELWDDRVAGIFLVNKDFDFTKKKLHTDIVPVRYDIFFTSDVNDYYTYARKSRTDAFWLVDAEHVISEVFKWVPAEHDQRYINIFKLAGQLEHKYPKAVTNVSDKRCGGIKLVPKKFNLEDLKYQGYLTSREVLNVEFEKFSSEEQGRQKTKAEWFWVIDPNVDVVEDFDFDFIPETWDAGKPHMWQKLNPVTGKQYDYGGVMLCPKVPQTKGRPKYIKETGCVQKKFPVCYLNPDQEYVSQLAEFESSLENSFYWVIDPYVELLDDFDFSYYPTQWDARFMHVFQDAESNYRNVRLVPKGMFTNADYTDTNLVNNTFDNLKLMNTVVSKFKEWPVIQFDNINRDRFVEKLKEYNQQGYAYVWTIDPDVTLNKTVITKGYQPLMSNVKKVHLWQILNPHTNTVHSYGGLRLWPTDLDYDQITTQSIKLNKLSNIQYVKQPGSTYVPFDIVFITYHDIDAESKLEKLRERFPNIIHIKDVNGIFEAHKAGAQYVESRMFWVIDADAELLPDFDFSYIPDVYDSEVVHVWKTRNPVTGDEYGYGGVKLFNTEQVLNATNWGLDFTTGLSSRFKLMKDISNVTRFNTDAFSTWRSAFREAVKLTVNGDEESSERLEGWLHPMPDAFFRAEAKLGAEQGRHFAKENINNSEQLAKINDFSWLKEFYEKQIS